MSRPRSRPAAGQPAPPPIPSLRIIGGRFRTRKLIYHGDPRTRPMKDRVREAVFSLLGDDVVGAHVVDLFAGSGALGLEALSRGAASATFVEQHFPTAAVLRENAAALDVAEVCRIHAANTLLWAERCELPADRRWLVFCSPPYAFYVERREATLGLINGLLASAPVGSALVVEADERFDLNDLPRRAAWDVRNYPPAVIAILRQGG